MFIKNFTLSSILLLFYSVSYGQCDIVNHSFEDWITTDLVLPDEDGNEVSAEILIPDGATSILRLLIFGLNAPFDPAIIELLETNAEALLGISQSTDASDGDFAVKLQGGYGYDVADIYTVSGCTELPAKFTIDVKHFGEYEDSLTVLVVFDQGFKGLPQTEEDWAAVPAFGFAYLGFNTNSEYETFSIPITEQFASPIDTMYYLIAAETQDTSYFLIDNITVSGEGSGCQLTAPALSLSDQNPTCICNNLDITFPFEYTKDPLFQYNEIIVDELGTIVSIDIFDQGIHNGFCDSSDSLTAMVIAYEGQVVNLSEGLNINTLSGCFELSNAIALETTTFPEFGFNIFKDGVQQDENIDICIVDDIIETFSFSTVGETDNIAIFLIDDFDDLVFLRIDDINETTDFMNVPPGDYVMAAISYNENFNLEVGQTAEDLSFDGCFSVSDFVYEVNILGPDDNCTTNTEEIYTGKLTIQPNLSNGVFEIYNPLNEKYELVVRDLGGKGVYKKENRNNEQFIELTSFPSGVYIATFTIDGYIHQEKIVKM